MEFPRGWGGDNFWNYTTAVKLGIQSTNSEVLVIVAGPQQK